MQIIVLGMHRSGTSVVTRLLNLMGAYFGPEGVMMESAADNKKGFWERNDVVAINDEILAAQGCSWDRVSAFSEDDASESVASSLSDRIASLVINMDAHRPWVIKDPRLCLTYPVWNQHLELPVGVFVHRSPLDIARSLEKRNGFSLRFGLALAEKYIRASIRAFSGMPVVCVSYERLMSGDTFGELELLRSGLVKAGVAGLRELTTAEVSAFIDGSLYHQRSGVSDDIEKWGVSSSFSSMLQDISDGHFPNELSETGAHYLSALKDYELIQQLKASEAELKASRLLLSNEFEEEKTSRVGEIRQHQENHSAAEAVWREREAALIERHNSIRDAFDDELKSAFDRIENQQQELIQTVHDQQGLLTTNKEALDNLIYQETVIEQLKSQLETAKDAEHHVQQLDQNYQELANKYNGRLEDVRYLMGILSSLDEDIRNTIASWRWRFGHYVANFIEKLTLRGRPYLSMDHAVGLLEQYRQCNPVYDKVSADKFLTRESSKRIIKKQWETKEEFTDYQLEKLNDFIDTGERLQLPQGQQPQVSIVLVLYNRAELTLACLRSILSAVHTDYEVIIVDNASSDRTVELIHHIDGVKIISNSENVGFVKAVNQALREVDGEYILLLNNDAQLFDSAIEHALQVFQKEKRVGAVGGKIILLDGTLQEAGDIVWSDGSCLGYGRGDSPFDSQYMFRRDVDYCSGAFLLTSTKLCRELGGFDEIYAPAYYEETDYCMRLWEKGYRVIYEPKCQVMHYEFGSSEKSESAIDLQTRNRKIFYRKYSHALRDHCQAAVEEILKARSHQRDQKWILYIEDRVPHVKLGSGFPRANRILSTLVELGYQITLYPLNFAHEERWETLYTDIPETVEVMVGYGREKLKRFLLERTTFYCGVIVSRPHNMEYYEEVVAGLGGSLSIGPLIYDAEAVFARRERVQRALEGRPMRESEYAKLLSRELRVAERAESISVVSEEERRLYQEHGFREVNVLGHVVSLNNSNRSFEERTDLLFVGNMDYDNSPNVDSLVWFVEEIFPEIRAANGMEDVRLLLVGTNKSRRLKALESDSVLLIGQVDDLSECYDKARLFIAPTRYAAGIPHKVHEAAANGIPCIITDLLLEQLGWTTGDEVLSSPVNDPAGFARNCIELYTNAGKWQAIKQNAFDRVSEECSEANFRVIIKEILERVVSVTKLRDRSGSAVG